MKTITKKYKIYTFDELDQKAKDKARQSFNEDMDYPFLTDDLREYIYEELKEKKLKVISEDITPYYSLSYCQGDGLMFEATLEDKKGNIYIIKHSGHYYHERSTDITGTDKKGNYIDTTDFEENTYIPICQKVAKMGYDEIEYNESEEAFAETCEANEYTFLEDGRMFNE
jgi:hypothetical protein